MATLLRTKALRDDLAFVERRLSEHTDPADTARVMWEERRDAILEELDGLGRRVRSHAEVALLFEGEPVLGSEEIRLEFATKALDNYQQVVGLFAAQRAGEKLAARGPLPGAYSSKLFIRDMMRGSVGFLLEEPEPDQAELVSTVMKDAVHETTETLADLSSGSSERFHERLERLSPRAVQAIKRMAKVLNDAGAETRIVGDTEVVLDHSSTSRLYARLTEVEVAERAEQLLGVLLGLFPDRRQFEFQLEDGSVLHGPVTEALSLRYSTDPDFVQSVLLRPGRSVFTVTTTIRGGQTEKQEWLLEDIGPGAAKS